MRADLSHLSSSSRGSSYSSLGKETNSGDLSAQKAQKAALEILPASTPPKTPPVLKKDYRSSLEAVLGPEIVGEYISNYFSSYSSEIQNNNQLIYKILSAVIRRGMLLQGFSKAAIVSLDLQNISSIHGLVPDWILQVAEYKINLENSIQRIQKLGLQREAQIIEPEKLKTALENIYKDLHGPMFEGFDRIDISVESSISYVQEGKTPLADFFNAFYVIPFDSEDHKKKYAVLDFRKIDSKDRKQALEAFKKQTGEGFADSMKQHAKTSSPGSVIYYHFSKDQIDAQIQYKGKIQGNIQVFYEDPKTLDALYGSFSSNKRMRLTTLQDQPPGSKWEKGDICRELKVDLGSRGGWSYGVGRVDRERTAAVDRSEFILICRLRMQHILEKGIKDLSLNDISNLQAYVEGVYASDLAGLPASYSKDPVFVQAFHQIKSIEQKLKEGIATQKYIKRLQEGLNIITKNKPINSNRAKLVITEIRDVLSKWNSNITEFLEFIDTSQIKHEKFAQIALKLQKAQPIITGFFESVDGFIQREEPTEDFLNSFTSQFKQLQAVVSDLQMIFSNDLIRKKYLEYAAEINMPNHIKMSALPAFFQLPRRLADCIKRIFEEGFPSLEEPIGKRALMTSLDVEEIYDEIDRVRSVLSAEIAALPPEQALQRFFPEYKPSLSESVDSWARGLSSVIF